MIRVLIAIFLPWLLFFTIGRPFSAVICLILQLMVVGSVIFTAGLSLGLHLLPSIWAMYALVSYKARQAA